MRALVALLWFAPAIADADGAADRDLLVEYRRLAGEAARTGNCDPARELAPQVKAMDPAYFANDYATDPLIAPCLPPPSSPAAIAPVDAPALLPPSLSQSQPVDASRVPIYLPTRPLVPPLEGGRLLGELAVGSLAGLGGALVGGLAGALLCVDDSNESGDLSCLASIVIGGYFVGSMSFGLGVAIVGRSGAQTGSTGAAVGGGLLGSLIGLGALVSLANTNVELGATILFAAPVLGAMIGFNVTRQWRAPRPVVGSLLRLDQGGVSLGIPFVFHGEQRGIPTTSVPLFSGSF